MQNIYRRYQQLAIPEKVCTRVVKRSPFQREGLYFIILGGADEIGMNFYLYYYKKKSAGNTENNEGKVIEDGEGECIIVDIGVKFNPVPVQDVIVGNPSFLLNEIERLSGIVITHSHEDHAGAVPYLITLLQKRGEELKAQNPSTIWNTTIYATKFTINFLKEKLKDFNLLDSVPMLEQPTRKKFHLGSFGIEFINITHSVPESNVVAITTDIGTIIHTGDWKLDAHPQVGETTDVSRIIEYGEQGNILACVCDSTKALYPGFSGSEEDVKKTIYKLVKSHEGKRIVLTCFASNIARLQSCFEAARDHGRKVALAGRSLIKMERIARISGYLKDVSKALDPKEAAQMPKSEVLWICTGSQAETDSAMYKISHGIHQHIKTNPGDIIIFSSSSIPGNEKEIQRMYNRLAVLDVEIINNDNELVHVSGHPYAEELKLMYKWVKPNAALPVHGGAFNTRANCRIAIGEGVPFAIPVRDGQVVKLGPMGTAPEIVDHVVHGGMIVQGKKLIEAGSRVHAIRDELLDGVIFLTILNMKLANVSCVGIFDFDGSDHEVNAISDIVKRACEATIKGVSEQIAKTPMDNSQLHQLLKKKLVQVVQNTIRNRNGSNPYVIVHI